MEVWKLRIHITDRLLRPVLAEVFAVSDATRTLVSKMTATMSIVVAGNVL